MTVGQFYAPILHIYSGVEYWSVYFFKVLPQPLTDKRNRLHTFVLYEPPFRSRTAGHITNIIMPPLVPLNDDKILLVTLSASYDPKTGAGINRQSLYDITRGDWIVNPERADKATHVLGVHKGNVVSVLEPIGLNKSTKSHKQQRHIFTGRLSANSPYLNTNVNHIIKPLRHIKYLF